MADVTYNTASFTALVNTIAALSHSAIDGQKPLIIVGYKERDPEERTLWAMLSDIGISLHKIAQRDGAGGAPVEIWVGQQAA
jgi:protein N-lysine methyltransferase METTL21D